MRRMLVFGVAGFLLGLTSCKTSGGNAHADNYHLPQRKKVAQNYHLKETQEVIEHNRKTKEKRERKQSRYKKKYENYLIRLNEYNRHKSQNKSVGAFTIY